MMKLITLIIACMNLITACASPNLENPSPPAVQPSPAPSITFAITHTPTFTQSATRSPSTVTPTLSPADTSTPGPTLPPAGIFADKFYPPLVLEYATDLWIDRSEYDNPRMMVNILQHRELKRCEIGTMGPSGFWPEITIDMKLGSVNYQVQLDQKTEAGEWISYYFAISAPAGIIDNDTGTAHFYVKSSPAEAKQCRPAAEAVFGTLRRADR